MSEQEYIEVYGARIHNLQNLDVQIPRDKLVVITGLSGSGKSSLAFDTIYAEGQRRYLETFSTYIRQFLGGLERPDVDKITGLSPVISIEQKTVSKNPRSTVGTTTDLYDFLRLLFARAGIAYSYNSNEPMVRYSQKQITELILNDYNEEKILVLAPVVRGRKGHYRDLFEQYRKLGYLRVRIDGEITELVPDMRVDRYKIHDIEIVIDRVKATKESEKRINEAIGNALKVGKGTLLIQKHDENTTRHFSKFLMCPTTGISYPEPEPNLFSFNSPYGACSNCSGLGKVSETDISKIIPDMKKSFKSGAIAPLGKTGHSFLKKQISAILKHDGYTEKTPFNEISEDTLSKLLNGTSEYIKVLGNNGINEVVSSFEGISNYLVRYASESQSASSKKWAEAFMNKIDCPKCGGSRLKNESLQFRIDNKNISEIAKMDLKELKTWLQTLNTIFDSKTKKIASEIIKEIESRLTFLLDVGLHYLTLDRSTKSLSGGEAQRIRLATQIGSELTGVLYILDEPSIGLHQRDNTKLIDSLKKLRDSGNSVIVVEHDKEIMEKSDWIIDIGPGAGVRGGKIITSGSHKELKQENSVTAKYLTGKLEIEVPKKRRPTTGKSIEILGAAGHNLKNVNLSIPLNQFVCITGVSGSGKSSLINQTLYPAVSRHLYKSVKPTLSFGEIQGLENVDKVININQSPIGRTPRSNPATYTGVFTDIRELYSTLPEAKIRGYKPGRFSFNVKGGRCETCKGAGLKTIEMNFLPDVHVPCESCQGKRYNRETLEVRYKGQSIGDVLDMEIEKAVKFFEHIPYIHQKLKTLHSVGLGYVTLGQPSTTLSGGEAQRVKLSTELSKKDTGNTLYILDEPSTGLHFEDIRLLLDVLQKLVDQGNSVLVIEHNLDIIKVADYVVDLGPEGGQGGGEIVAQGTPEEISKNNKSHTGKYLLEELT